MSVKYLLGSTAVIPLLPLMYYQGKKIKSSVPKLPEAAGTYGIAGKNADNTFNLLTIGESTMAGVGVSTHEEGFTGTLAKELASDLDAKIQWKVYAKSGYTAGKVCACIIPEIKESKVDLIVIGLGGNDAFELNSPWKWQKDIHRLIVKLRSRYGETPIVFANMPPIKEFPAFTSLIKFSIGNLVEILGDKLQESIRQHQNVHYDSRKLTLADWIGKYDDAIRPSDFFSDGVHPSKLTYQIWAKELSGYILKRGIV